jgi:hypothetical protein
LESQAWTQAQGLPAGPSNNSNTQVVDVAGDPITHDMSEVMSQAGSCSISDSKEAAKETDGVCTHDYTALNNDGVGDGSYNADGASYDGVGDSHNVDGSASRHPIIFKDCQKPGEKGCSCSKLACCTTRSAAKKVGIRCDISIYRARCVDTNPKPYFVPARFPNGTWSQTCGAQFYGVCPTCIARGCIPRTQKWPKDSKGHEVPPC